MDGKRRTLAQDLRFLVSGPALSEAFIALYDSSTPGYGTKRAQDGLCLPTREAFTYFGTGCYLSQVCTRKAKRLADAFSKEGPDIIIVDVRVPTSCITTIDRSKKGNIFELTQWELSSYSRIQI